MDSLSLESKDAEFDCRQLLRFVLRGGSQELLPYFPTKLNVTGARVAEYGYRGLIPSGTAGVQKDAKIGFRRSPTLDSRQQSASATIFNSSLDSGRPSRSKRSARTMACRISIESSKRSLTRI